MNIIFSNSSAVVNYFNIFVARWLFWCHKLVRTPQKMVEVCDVVTLRTTRLGRNRRTFRLNGMSATDRTSHNLLDSCICSDMASQLFVVFFVARFWRLGLPSWSLLRNVLGFGISRNFSGISTVFSRRKYSYTEFQWPTIVQKLLILSSNF